jgi:hypothetical protein
VAAIWHDWGVLGAAIIVFVLVIFIPVSVMMSGSLGAMLIGWFLRDESDKRHEGSELIDLNG